MSNLFDRPSCNMADPDRLRHTPVECRNECACGGRWGSQSSVPTPDSPKISPEDAQPRESASEAERFTLQQEFAAADYLEQRLADADVSAGAGWCLDLTRCMIRVLNGCEPRA